MASVAGGAERNRASLFDGDRPLPIEKASTRQGIEMQVTTIVFLVLTWIAILLRMWTRFVLVHAVGWDDYTMLFSCFLFTIYCVSTLVCLIASTGGGYLMVSEVDVAINWLLVAEAMYIVTIMALKISLAIFFLRIMIKKWQRQIVYAAILFSTTFNVAYLIFSIFQCGIPAGAKAFLTRKFLNQCVNKHQILGFSYSHGIVTSLTDVLFAVLPLAMLRDAKMATRERVIVGFILVLGALGGLASMVRLVYIPRLATTSQTFFADSNLISIWSTVELSLGIIASSLATLRPLFRSCLESARAYAPNRSRTHELSYPVNGYNNRTATKKDGQFSKDSPALSVKEFYEGIPMDKSIAVNGRQHIVKEPWKPGGKLSRTNTPVFGKDAAPGQYIELKDQMGAHSVEHLSQGTFERFPAPPKPAHGRPNVQQ